MAETDVRSHTCMWLFQPTWHLPCMLAAEPNMSFFVPAANLTYPIPLTIDRLRRFRARRPGSTYRNVWLN